MGNTLCEEQEDVKPDAKLISKITIFGDYINSDTRLILACLKISGEPHEYVNMNTLQNEHRDS